MNESDRLLGALRDSYGYDSFRPQQRETIEHVLDGGDALVLMPTGGGKSLCYQLPAILSDGLTVVVSPLIALMHDQVTTLQRAGANAQYLNSTLSPMETGQVERLVVEGSVKLLYVAPERVNTDRFRNLLERRNPSLIAIDEAHCISEWGHEFRPDYRVLRRLTERFVDVPTVACTATATPQVQRDIIDQLDRPRMQTYITSFMRENLTLRVLAKRKAVDRLATRLKRVTDGAAIVYSQSRKSTEETAARLRQHGLKAEHYHAGMNGQDRHAVQDRFLSGETPVICATIAFGMGIDKADIRLVAHLDMPPSIESYYQETGRAGRDGQPSECLLFYTKGIWHQQMFFINQLTDDSERQQRINRLRTMMNFSEQSQCRWSRILQYFGEQPASAQCGHCDNCLGEETIDVEEETPRIVDPEQLPNPPGG
ncbi:MAG: ATP-dependent DNA helicase, partial [Chloroflexi bacterium]|nr:ATP-dependent DNA helicase [Chloroflexota bacterium]